MPGIVNFTFLGAEFCIPTNIIELYSGTQLSYLIIIWWFEVLLLRFIRWGQSSTQSMANDPVLTRQDFSVHYMQCPVNHEVFQSGWWEEGIFLVLCEYWASLPLIFQVVLSPSLLFPNMHTLLQTWRESLQLFGVISLCGSLLSSTLSQKSSRLISPGSQLCLLTQWHQQTPSGFLLALWPGN